jgi:glucuronoarabinoxylan endo-1,4-beta-xylanase
MKHPHRRLALLLGMALLPLATGQAWGQATVDLAAQKQYIRGFGGMVHIPWAGDLSAAERTLAFGKGDGQLGFTVLRIAVPDSNNSDTSYVTTAKAVIAAGGLVYATPWNGKSTMNTADFATYANHLAAFATTMKNAGAELYAISTQNEPDYANEWRSWTPEQCHDFVLNYGDKVGTKLMGCESFNYAKKFYDPILNDAAALEKLGVLGTHLYGTAVSGYPYPLFDTKAAGKVERWMTEHYTDSNTDANSWPNALGVATELHNSMVKAQFNAYTWWYIKRSYGPINNGAVTKRGWCMAHWSKFIRPGFYRVDATEAPKSGVSLSAYKSNTDVVIVAVNTGSAASVDVSIKGSSISSFDKYTTSSSKSFASDGKVAASGGTLTLALDGSSVTTFHGTSSDIPISTGGSGGGGSTGSGGAGGTTAATTSTRTGGTVTGGRTTGAGGTVAGGTAATSTSRVGGSSAVSSSSAAGGASVVGSSSLIGGSSSSAVASSSQAGSAGGAGSGAQSSSEQGGASGAGNDSSKSSTPVVTGNDGGGCTFMSGSTRSGLLPFALTLAGLLGLLGLLARRRRSR